MTGLTLGLGWGVVKEVVGMTEVRVGDMMFHCWIGLTLRAREMTP
jgi:hypothetical protein